MLDRVQIKQHDSEDMLHLLSTFSEQCRRGWEIGKSLDLAGCDTRIPNNIVIAGMGGSGISGDLVKAVVGDGLPCPIIVHRGYTLPAFVSSQTLFVAVSYSGNTEETLLSVKKAFAQGAKILAVTSGGKLKGFADAHGFPCLAIQSFARLSAYADFIGICPVWVYARPQSPERSGGSGCATSENGGRFSAGRP